MHSIAKRTLVHRSTDMPAGHRSPGSHDLMMRLHYANRYMQGKHTSPHGEGGLDSRNFTPILQTDSRVPAVKPEGEVGSHKVHV